jgi:hypothetical protein
MGKATEGSVSKAFIISIVPFPPMCRIDLKPPSLGFAPLAESTCQWNHFAPVQVDVLGAQETPHLLFVHVAQSAAIRGPVHFAIPAGGGLSSTARMRWPVSFPYLGAGPGRGLSTKRAKPSRATPRAHRPRHLHPCSRLVHSL